MQHSFIARRDPLHLAAHVWHVSTRLRGERQAITSAPQLCRQRKREFEHGPIAAATAAAAGDVTIAGDFLIVSYRTIRFMGASFLPIARL